MLDPFEISHAVAHQTGGWVAPMISPGILFGLMVFKTSYLVLNISTSYIYNYTLHAFNLRQSGKANSGRSNDLACSLNILSEHSVMSCYALGCEEGMSCSVSF